MEILYPVKSLVSTKSVRDTGVTVLANHSVAVEKRVAFLEAVRELLEGFDKVPGALGCQVFEQEEGDVVRVSMVQRFATEEDHEAWRESGDFARWQQKMAELPRTLEQVHRYSGMDALFAAGVKDDAPPRWKMAVVLMLAVFPLSFALSQWFGRALASVPPLFGALVSTPVMVILMTYVMVPLFTKLMGGWLQPKAS